MTSVKRILCCVLFFAATTVSQAHAWHGPFGFNGHGYGFGLNHHSFRPSIYNPGWSSYSRASFYSSYGYGGYGYGGLGYSGLGYGSYGYGSVWPRASYHISYRSYAPVFYTNSWPTYSTSYYAPTYCAPITYGTYYAPYVAPVIYSSNYSGFPSCAVSPVANSLPFAAYSVKKPVANSAAFQLASQTVRQVQQAQLPQAQIPQALAPAGRYVLAQGATQAATSALDSAPDELMAAADAILAAGGYRQAAQAYAQIVVKYGNSDRLVTRRFIAQVASSDFEQAAVVIELAAANGNRLNRHDLPQGSLQIALGDSAALIVARSESLAAIALKRTDDAVPMLAVAHWLSLTGDNQRAELFKARADQMQHVAVGLLIHKPSASPIAAQNPN